tara:strand:- start:1106 stop:1585 length:480 start_codon:yes stop_codon:yes gene_type:complete
MNFNEITHSLDTFNNMNMVNKIDRTTYVDKSKGNQYELDQFNWTMKCRNYRQKMRHISHGFKVKVYDNVSSLDKVQQMLYKSEVSQSWTRLEKQYKLEKISDYIDTLGFTGDKLKQIKTYIYTAFKENKLKSSKSVIYNKNECKIISIPVVKEYIKTLK